MFPSLKQGTCPFKSTQRLNSPAQNQEHKVIFRPAERFVIEDIASNTGKMVDKFVGTWRMVSSENFDDYMKAIGKTICALSSFFGGNYLSVFACLL